MEINESLVIAWEDCRPSHSFLSQNASLKIMKSFSS